MTVSRCLVPFGALEKKAENRRTGRTEVAGISFLDWISLVLFKNVVVCFVPTRRQREKSLVDSDDV